MNMTAHQITHRLIDDPVTLGGIVTGKHRRDYGDFVMAAIPRPGMAGMQVRFILDFQLLGVERHQALAQQCRGFAAHAGKAFLNGLTVTLA